MPKTVVTPPGTGTPIAPYSPGTLADGVVYVSGTLPFDKDNNVVHVGDVAAQTRHVLQTIKSVIETAGGRRPLKNIVGFLRRRRSARRRRQKRRGVAAICRGYSRLALGGVDSKDSLLGTNQIQGCFLGRRSWV